jgi:hypothetical protein
MDKLTEEGMERNGIAIEQVVVGILATVAMLMINLADAVVRAYDGKPKLKVEEATGEDLL